MATLITSRDQGPQGFGEWFISMYLSHKDDQVPGGIWEEHLFDLQQSEIGNKRSLAGQPIHYFEIKGKDLRRFAMEEAEEFRKKHKLPDSYSLNRIIGIADSE